ncbi:MAG: segregation and condensation protein A [Planctomycetota bacterium]|jgi:segregation and condensation protein A
MENYRVKLEIYDGPLDLLLYLIRREEVDIHDIPIAQITEQYLRYVDLLKIVDPDLAGEFMVMAATLMEIKTRMLLPAPQAGEDVEGVEIDPRAELVRQLLQYKAFKDAAGDLEGAAAQQALKFPRAPAKPEVHEEPTVDLEDVQIWDLFDALSKLMEAIGHRPTHHEVIYDDTPVELHAADILDRLDREGGMTFARIFEGRTVRSEIVGLFVALLELIRRRKVSCRQRDNFGEIHVELNPNPPADEEPPEAEAAATAVEAEEDRTSESGGTYMPEAAETPQQDRKRNDEENDTGEETSPVGD